MKPRPSIPLLAALSFFGVLSLPPDLLRAQTAREILETAVERHEARVAGIDDYTVVEDVNGAEQTVYFEKRTVDGRPVFVRMDAADLALGRAGVSWPQLQQMMTGAFSQAGLQAVAGELNGASRDQLGRLVASMGQRMAGPSAGDVVAAAKNALVDAGTDALKDALVDAAVEAGLQAVASGLAGAAGPAVATVIQALRDANGFGDALGHLARALPRMAGAVMPGGQGAPGTPGMNTLPGGIQGGPMGANLAGDPRSQALSAAASVGFRMLVGAGTSAVRGLFSSDRVDTSGDPYAVLRELADGVDVAGSETLDGRAVWVLEARDPAALGTGDGFAPRELTFRIDDEDYLLRDVRMVGEVETEEGRRPMTVRVSLEDYREVEGLLHPFRTTTAFGGMDEQVPEAERAEMSAKMEEARRQMARMREQLADLPPEQRRMVEQQLERMGGMDGLEARAERQMDALLQGRMESVVRELRVNTGPPDAG